MSDALQDSEKVDLEEVQKPLTAKVDEEPDEESLARVEREEEERDAADDYEDFAMDAIKLYLKDIQKTNLLTAEEERALARRIDDGDMAARDKMIESNLRLVVKIAKRSAIIFGLGLFLNGYPFGLFGPRQFAEVLDTWRIPGVLQRIALAYLLAVLIVLACGMRVRAVAAAVKYMHRHGQWRVGRQNPDRQVDGLLVLLTPQAMTDPTACAEGVVAAARKVNKPVLACWMGENLVKQGRKRFTEAGIPEFASP